MARMEREEAFDLASDLVPSMKGRGLKINEVAKKLLSNPWLNTPDPVEVEFNIKKNGFNLERKISCYVIDDLSSLRDELDNIIKFVTNNLDK